MTWDGPRIAFAAAIVAFVGLSAVGACRTFPGDRKAAAAAAPPKAVRALAANRLLLASDLRGGAAAQKTALVGRYLREEVRAGAAVAAKDVLGAPDLTPTAGSLAVGLPIKRALVTKGVVNAEVSAAACDPSGAATPVVVAAVACGAADAAYCSAYVTFRPSKTETAAKLLGTGIEIESKCTPPK